MRSKNGKQPQTITVDSDLLAELTPGGDGGGYDDLSQFDWSPFIRLATACTSMGGMVTLYRRADSGSLCVSARIGDKRNQWEFDTPEQWDELLPIIADRYFSVYGKWLARNRSANSGHEPTKSD